VTVASEVTGKIVRMPVEEGTPVTAGRTLLAQIDDVWSRLALAQCLAQVASTEATLKYELSELDRLEALRERNAVTISELEAKRSTVAELRARLVECKAAVEEKQERKGRSHVLAPFDGVVVAKHAEWGGHVVPGTPIVDVVSRGRVDARLMVPESVVNRVRIGAALPIRVDPLGESFVGTVVSVIPYGPSASRTFPVRIRLDDREGRLKVGMSVTAVIAVGPLREALVVSKNAVLVRPDGSTVWVAVRADGGEDATVHPVPVVLTVRMQDEYAVESETDRGRELLEAGASVVVEGAERLTPDQRVRVVTLPSEPDAAAERSGLAGPAPSGAGGEAVRRRER